MMAMKIKHIFTIIFAFVFYCNGFSKSIETKSLIINSLTNKPEKVLVELDYVNNRITIKSGFKKKLYLDHFTDLEGDIKVMNKKFILLQYNIRGGSGVKLEKTTLVCINNGHLLKSLDIISLDKYEFKETYDKVADSLKLYDESGIYSLKLVDFKYEKKNFKLSIIQYQKVRSKHYNNGNYENTDTIKLKFDQKNKVFYNKKISLKGKYTIENSNIKQKTFNGKMYPSIELKNYQYFIIDNIWYYKFLGNILERG